MTLSHAHAALLALVSLTAVATARPAWSGGSTPDPKSATFADCHRAHRVTCVVDGDTIWYRGEKIRIADINAPELGRPQCRFEARLARAATDRLAALLNAGAFSLAPWPQRRIDRYGRSLYVIERDGRSIGLELVREGLADRWRGYRRDWCADIAKADPFMTERS